MLALHRTLLVLETAPGKAPFLDWLENLGDKRLKATVEARLTRLVDGNLGDHRFVGSGVYELRIHSSPGLRIYYGLTTQAIVVLIGGGTKSTQSADILKAHERWKEYLDEHTRV